MKISSAFALCAALMAAGCTQEETPTGDPGGGGNIGGYKKDGSLPMLVSANGFAPNGFMGDGGSTPGALTMATTECLMPRGEGAAGDCYKITYLPGPAGWAGVYWQYPSSNWGTAKGRKVEAGATKLTFYAAAALDSTEVEISAGGINTYGADGEHSDAFKAQKSFKLATTWTRYTLDLGTPTYDEVIGGFCWAMPGMGTEPIVFYLDDIKWEK